MWKRYTKKPLKQGQLVTLKVQMSNTFIEDLTKLSQIDI